MPVKSKPLLIFAHGAGASSTHPWMQHWAALLSQIGTVHIFDYRYIVEGRRPDRLAKLILEHREALENARGSNPGPVVLIGKSMGGRIGCHLALEQRVEAVVCLGYPLCGGADCTKLRDRVLLDLAVPILFVQGTRDALCPLDVLAGVRSQMHARNDLHVVQGGDHSLLVTKRQLKASGKTQERIDQEILESIRQFVAKGTGDRQVEHASPRTGDEGGRNASLIDRWE